ncbi:unnamed protein product, partial [Ectocarpus sp. 12 AP-2014]
CGGKNRLLAPPAPPADDLAAPAAAAAAAAIGEIGALDVEAADTEDAFELKPRLLACLDPSQAARVTACKCSSHLPLPTCRWAAAEAFSSPSWSAPPSSPAAAAAVVTFAATPGSAGVAAAPALGASLAVPSTLARLPAGSSIPRELASPLFLLRTLGLSWRPAAAVASSAELSSTPASAASWLRLWLGKSSSRGGTPPRDAQNLLADLP